MCKFGKSFSRSFGSLGDNLQIVNKILCIRHDVLYSHLVEIRAVWSAGDSVLCPVDGRRGLEEELGACPAGGDVSGCESGRVCGCGFVVLLLLRPPPGCSFRPFVT